MTTSETTGAYARALYDLAALTDSVDAADESLAAIVEAIRGNVALRDALADPAVPGEKKRAIVRDVFTAQSPEAVAVAGLLAERGEAASIDAVAAAYREIAEKERGIVVAEVTTAVPLDEALRSSVTGKLSASLGRPVALRERVDAAVLGGIRIKVAGRVLDGTLSSQVNAMRAVLSSTPQGGEG
ncbi:MAG: ATP synthase F1 subunit delta [Actinobacteria bacterium]|nr:MAG: ATP synthase F1 subunit delta [Actinomycetota bacterium]